MDEACKLSNEVGISESKPNVPAFQAILNDIRESTASCAQNSNTSLAAEDLLIKQAIALPSLSENEASNEDATNSSTDKTSDGLVGAIISTGKRLSIALSSAASSTTAESEEDFSDTTSVEQTPAPQIDNNTQASSALPSVQVAASIGTPQKKQHIMISYNRSCEDGCRKIRNKLRGLKYKVWMDVYDMPNNFIDGMAKAIRNSYIVLLCINRQYDDSFWCKKEAEDVAIKRISFIPCFMETPFPLDDWLDFLVGANIWIDFSKEDKFDDSFGELIKKITCIEGQLATSPRETPPTTPSTNPLVPIPSDRTVEESFDNIMRNFKTWVEDNRHNLRRCNRKESSQLIHQLIQGLQRENNTFDDHTKSELLQQLLSSNLHESNNLVSRLSYNLNTADFPLMKSLFFIMALWAVRIVFQKKSLN